MRATVLYGAGDVRVENVPDARLIEPTDALVTVSRACICGSDLWPYQLMQPGEPPRRMGHEAIGVVEAVGSGVRTLKIGDVVVMPFAYSDVTCAFCYEGLHTSCVHGGFFGRGELPGAQPEPLRIPLAYGTLFALPAGAGDALMASLLTLSAVPASPRARRARARSLRSTTVSRWAAGRTRSEREFKSCFPMCSRARSSLAGCSIASSDWMGFPTGTAP